MPVCPQCNAELKAGVPAGLCPVCLLRGGAGSGFTFSEPETQTLAAQTQDAATQDSFGPYRILKVLGEGGMGTVYLAEQTEPMRRRVALKVVKLGMDTNQVLARFNHERQVLARMQHSGIARILDAGASSRGRPFFVMDYIEGDCITTWSDRSQLTTVQRLELFIPVCRAVQHAHNKGIIHRDIKPSNILVALEDGREVPKVIDFGIARAIETGEPGSTFATQFGQMVGTPEYASPEQADLAGGEISAASDVYSLGVLLYEMLVGSVPFDGALLRREGLAEMLRIIREEEAPSLIQRFERLGAGTAEIAACRGTSTAGLRKLLAGHLNRIVKKALEKSPQRRYASPSDLAADIERYLKGEPVLAGPGRAPRVPTRSKPRSTVTATVVLTDVANDTGDPSFDNLFRQSISFELQRSANVNLLPAGRVSETLRLMRRTAQTGLTPEIAREIGERTASAAFIESSLSSAGSGYLLTLRARACITGDLLGEEQARAASKDDVLNKLRRLTKGLQSKSAASLVTLQDSATLLEAATTSSLEALKSFCAARRYPYANATDALALYKRAVEIDPEFAMAYAYLGRAYADSGEQSLGVECIRQAWLLRGIVSDRENLFIEFNYNRDVLRNFELCRRVCDSWAEKYPQDLVPHGFLSGLTSTGTAQYEKAIEEAEKAIDMDPDFTIGYGNIGLAQLALNRPEHVEAAMHRAAQRKLRIKDPFGTPFFAAFLRRDRSAMDREGAQLAADCPYGVFEHYQSLVSAYQGRLRQSRQASIQAVTLARQAHLVERAALFEGAAAAREALYGYPDESSRHSFAAGQIASGRDANFPPAFALALTRNSAFDPAIVADLEKQYPEDTCVRFSYVPALRALFAMNEGDPATAIECLDVSKAYELALTGVSGMARYGAMYPTYVRGLAYRQMHKHREAAAEFQRMLDHPGLLLADPVGPAALLQLARALRDSGETTKAKAVCSEFLILWKDADPDIPLLKQAKTEFAGL